MCSREKFVISKTMTIMMCRLLKQESPMNRDSIHGWTEDFLICFIDVGVAIADKYL